ncbi:MAG: IS200/IS605 family transposase [Chlamydiales bacterium]|nr:IS200/IS605 family transposase [Chlamydiales bacterium]
MGHSCVEVYIHAIFSTKNRFPLIPEELETRLYAYISGVAKQNNIPILDINGVSDHIHILLKLSSTITISTLLKELKSYSSAWMKKQNIKDFAWQEGYAAYSCSITHVDALKQYIATQKEHHKTVTYVDEIIRLNKLWNTNFSPDAKSDTESDLNRP